MNRIELSSAIVTIVKGIINDSDYTVIIADQSAHRPKGAYASVKIITSQQETTEYTSSEATGYLSSSQQKVMISFNFFRDESFEKATLVRKAFWRREVSDLLQEIGLGLSVRGSVENLTDNLEVKFEERANFIARFNYNEVDYDSEYIRLLVEQANISGIVSYQSIQEPIDIEIKQS